MAEEAAGREGAPLPDLVVPRWSGRLEPLCALYAPRALATLAHRAASGRFALHELAEEANLTVRYLEEASRFGAPDTLFFNLNTPADLEAWLSRQGAVAFDATGRRPTR
jgi:molybdopterin-guanine dinucleotide biosynthesis protein A